MPTLSIVKGHDVSKEFSSSLSMGSKYNISTFALQGRPETLHGRIIPTITDAAHADGHVGSHQAFLVIKAGVLAATIRMMQYVARRTTLRECHVECAFDQFGTQMVRHDHTTICRE